MNAIANGIVTALLMEENDGPKAALMASMMHMGQIGAA
jgi:hypothetical protein